MHFYALLTSGASVKSTAKLFFSRLLRRSQELKDLDLSMAANFINDIMHMIGLRSSLTAEELKAYCQSESTDANFKWPDEHCTYVFQYNALTFSRLEEFLVVLSEIVHECTEEHFRQLEAEEVSEEINWPVEVWMYLLSLWYAACKSLLKTERYETPHFEEPLARINYHLLLGVHKLRMHYSMVFPVLHKICERLYRIALPGIFYREAHQCIILGLLQIFEKDFVVFQNTAPDTMDFFYEAFSVKDQKKTCILTYKRLTYMLIYHSKNQEQDASMPNKLLILTNYLVTEKMLNVYYTHLKIEKAKRLIFVVLNFLEILQSKLLALDNFPQSLMEAILNVVLTSDISSTAAELYITMMRRKLSDDLILKHMIDYYASTQQTPQQVDHYVISFWPYFQYMRASDPYLAIITRTKINKLRYFTAHVLISVFKQMQNEIDTYRRIVAKTLYNLPQFLDELNCTITKNILLGILLASDFDKLGKKIAYFQQFLYEFERYAEKKFMENDNFFGQWNLFTQYHRCITYTNNWDLLEVLAINVYRTFRHCDQQLQQNITTNQSPSIEFLHEYNQSLQKLHIVLKLDYQILDYINELYDTMTKRLMQKPSIGNLIESSELLMDVHAIEILTSCIMKLVQAAGNGIDECHNLCMKAQILQRYLFAQLQYSDESELIKQPFLRLSTIFNCIITIYCIFSKNNINYTLKLEMRAYNILVNVLIALTLKPHINDLNIIDSNGNLMCKERIYELQKSMLQYFVRLHATPTLEIPSNIVWKVCIYYGLRNQNIFKNELITLLRTLASDRYEMYKHCLAVLVYNLHKQQPPLNSYDIMTAINSHERLIELREMNIKEPALLRVHIVLVVLQIIEKSLNVVDLNIQYNRLAPLKYLSIFTKPLNVNSENVLTDIRRQAQTLKHYPLTNTEEMELKRFESHYQEEN